MVCWSEKWEKASNPPLLRITVKSDFMSIKNRTEARVLIRAVKSKGV